MKALVIFQPGEGPYPWLWNLREPSFNLHFKLYCCFCCLQTRKYPPPECSDCSGNKICLWPRNENIFRHRGNIFPIMCKTKLIIFNLIISSSRHYYHLAKRGKGWLGWLLFIFCRWPRQVFRIILQCWQKRHTSCLARPTEGCQCILYYMGVLEF